MKRCCSAHFCLPVSILLARVNDDDVTRLGAFYEPSVTPLNGPLAELATNAIEGGVAAVHWNR
jgi:hypothetical protein